MKKLIAVFITLIPIIAVSQEEASNWYFGDNAGISFNNDGSVNVLNDGQLTTFEGCTSISDSNSNLLFYTDGITVYNRNHQVMQNGTGLLGDPSSSQSAIIIPKPFDPNIYYIFTQSSRLSNREHLGFNYSEVDMTLNGGLGAITTIKNQRLLYKASEKISAVLKDCSSQSIWVITLAQENALTSNNELPNENYNTFYAFEVSSTGVNAIPEATTFNNITINDQRGYLKFSPDGTKLAFASVDDGFFLFDFDRENGTITNDRRININPNGLDDAIYPYGLEFSPNSNLLYVNTYNDFFTTNEAENENPTNHKTAILQYNLEVANINGSQTAINPTQQGFRRALQLAPNGKIYISSSALYNYNPNLPNPPNAPIIPGSPHLSAINSPNILGNGCEYEEVAIELATNTYSRQGLPPFITSFFDENIDIIQNGISEIELDLCEGDTYTLMATIDESIDVSNATYTWWENSVLLPETGFELDIDSSGFYEVLIEFPTPNCDTYVGKANVSYFQYPIPITPTTVVVCDDDNNGLTTFNDFNDTTTEILAAQINPLQYDISYHLTETDAENDDNEITFPFQNTTIWQQTIYVRLENRERTECYTTTQFDIEIYFTPQVIDTSNLETCDQDSNGFDGITTFNLLDFNQDIIGDQNPTLYEISYHETEIDAIMRQNPLPNTYTNTNPFVEPIFVRIENINNTNCYTTQNIEIRINDIPEAINTSIFQCNDETTVNGFTTYNLTEINNEITNNAPDRTIAFYLTQNNALNDINPLNAEAYNNTSNPQTVYTRVTNNNTGCFNTSVLTLEISTTQFLNYYPEEICDELSSQDGFHTFNLDEFSVNILNIISANNLSINYYDTYTNALIEQNPLSSPYTNTIPYEQTIYARVEDGNACYGINALPLVINPLPVIDNNETITYCLNRFPETITLESGTYPNDANTYTYLWSTGETSESIEVNSGGNYTVTATYIDTGCTNSRTITIEESNIATIEDITVVDGSLNNNQITVTATGEGDYQYALTSQYGDTTGFQSSSIFTNVPAGLYTITIRDIKNNCGIIEKNVSAVGFPRYFTPNNDGIHDTWQVYGVSELFQANAQILIFDRFGKLLTTLDPASNGWDGMYNGNAMPTNDYWFKVTLEDGRVYKNHFTLKR